MLLRDIARSRQQAEVHPAPGLVETRQCDSARACTVPYLESNTTFPPTTVIRTLALWISSGRIVVRS
jgi:hypothetical protein